MLQDQLFSLAITHFRQIALLVAVDPRFRQCRWHLWLYLPAVFPEIRRDRRAGKFKLDNSTLNLYH